MPDDTTKVDNQVPIPGAPPTSQSNPAPPVAPTMNTPPPPIQDGTASPPPPIVEEKKPEKEQPKETKAAPDIPPVISTSPGSGGKKPVNKKMIATILGVLVLVGGIGAGVVLVQKQQDIREKAAVEEGPGGGGGAYCSDYMTDQCIYGCTPTTGGGKCKSAPSTPKPTPKPAGCKVNTDCGAGEICLTNGKCVKKDEPDPTPKPPNACDRSAPSVAPGPDGKYCDDKKIGASCVNRDGTTGTCQEIGDSSLGGTQVECKCATGGSVPTPKPTPKPSAPPGFSCACNNIKTYDAEWNLISNLTNLKAGDVVRFTVSGTSSSGAIDKARFTINGSLGPEVTTKKPGTNEFYTEYTIPEGVTSFTVNAELHHTAIGWF